MMVLMLIDSWLIGHSDGSGSEERLRLLQASGPGLLETHHQLLHGEDEKEAAADDELSERKLNVSAVFFLDLSHNLSK